MDVCAQIWLTDKLSPQCIAVGTYVQRCVLQSSSSILEDNGPSSSILEDNGLSSSILEDNGYTFLKYPATFSRFYMLLFYFICTKKYLTANSYQM